MEKEKSVWLVIQDWENCGDTITNDVLAVCGSLKRAKKRLVEEIAYEFDNHQYDAVELTPYTTKVEAVNLKELANMFTDDEDFDTDLTGVECWDGNDRALTERYFAVRIEERKVLV